VKDTQEPGRPLCRAAELAGDVSWLRSARAAQDAGNLSREEIIMTMTTARQDKELWDLILEDAFRKFDAVMVVEWVAKTFSPEDVFDHKHLEKWAKENGYAKEE
jgi:hypothetical protein